MTKRERIYLKGPYKSYINGGPFSVVTRKGGYGWRSRKQRKADRKRADAYMANMMRNVKWILPSSPPAVDDNGAIIVPPIDFFVPGGYESEQEHFMDCNVCGEPMDMRDLSQVFKHEHDDNLPVPEKKYNSKKVGEPTEYLKGKGPVNLN